MGCAYCLQPLILEVLGWPQQVLMLLLNVGDCCVCTHHDVSFHGDGHSEPGGDADAHVEEVVRCRVEIGVGAHTPRRVHRQQQNHDEVKHIREQLQAEEGGIVRAK